MMVRVVLAALALAAALPGIARGEELPKPGELPPPGSYERQSLDRALGELKLEVEPAPDGKVLRKIWVVNYEVFGPRNGFLQFFNVFHRTTRWRQIAREVVLQPGHVWDPQKIWETERKLRDPIFTSLVVLMPVKSGVPGKVDLLVVTRDVWSLRFNTNFEFQSGTFVAFTASISENNFLGLRKQTAAVFSMDQGSIFFGPLYVNKNIAGTRLRLSTHAGPLFSRATGKLEGSRSSTALTYPFWSTDSKWGGGLTVSHYDGVVRVFQGLQLRTYDDPDTPEVEAVPWTYDQRNISAEAVATQSFGRKVVQRVSGAYDLAVQRPTLRSDFNQPAEVRDAFVRDVFPRSERTSSLVARYQVFTPRYVAYRDIDTYDLREDASLGPDLTVSVGSALKLIGSEQNFLFGSVAAGYTLDWSGDGFVRVSATTSSRMSGTDFYDGRLELAAKLATPRLGGIARIAARVEADALLDERQNRFYTLGGTSGLRGYPIGDFIGERRVRANVELRSMPLKLWFFRAGGIAFVNAGHAADHVRDLSLQADVGVGIRWLIPQLSPLAYRLDWAIPLTGQTPGFPGRLLIGVDQVF